MKIKLFFAFVLIMSIFINNCSSITMKINENLSGNFKRYELTKKPGLFSKTELEFKNYYASDCKFTPKNISKKTYKKDFFDKNNIEETKINKTYQYTFTNKNSKQQWDVILEETGQGYKEYEKEKDGETIYEENNDYEFLLTVKDKQTKDLYFKLHLPKNKEPFYGFVGYSNNNVTGTLVLPNQTTVNIVPTNEINDHSVTYAFATGYHFIINDTTVAGMEIINKGGFILNEQIESNLIDPIAIVGSALYFLSQGGLSVTTSKGNSIFN